MRFLGFLICLCFSVFTHPHPISAHFFPNISSIPSWLNHTKCAWEEFQKLGGCRPGDTVDGLSNLKNYFKRFGYIPFPPDSSNFTELFDHALQSAIKTYQKNFNLNVTGELDQQTLRQIQLPRCGMPDIINAAGNPPPPANGSTFHSVSHYSFFPGVPRWPPHRRDLSYAFEPRNQLSDEVKSVFGRAFSRWAAVTPLTFTAVDSYPAADIRIGFFSGDHGDGEAFDGVLGTLAHAFSPPSGLFHLDLDENWVVSGDIRTASLRSAIDLESVAVHEIGHLLGLGHSSVEESIMFPTITSRTRKVDLAADDINGIQQLYGGNPNGSNSTTQPSVQERDTSPPTPTHSAAHVLRPCYYDWWSSLLLMATPQLLLLLFLQNQNQNQMV